MQSNIEVKFLTPKEMENAFEIDSRYEHVNKANLGFADPVKNRIYVRAGLDADLTKYLLNHELNHLFELEGSDEDENGIRHKSGWDIAKWFTPVPYAEGLANLEMGSWTGGMYHPFQGAFGSNYGSMGSTGADLGMFGASLIPGLGPYAAMGEAVGAGLGGMAGKDIQEQATTGQPNWGQNALQAGESTAANLIGQNVTGALNSPQTIQGTDVGGTNAFGQTMNPSTGNEAFSGSVSGNPTMGGWGSNLLGQAAGTLANQGFGMMSSSPSYGQMFNTNASGMGGMSMPTQGMTPGFTPGTVGGGSAGTGGQQGSLAQMAGNAGVGQAGITLGGQMGMPNTGQTGSNTGTGQGGNMANMGMEKSVGFNPFNGGSISFGNPRNVENIW